MALTTKLLVPQKAAQSNLRNCWTSCAASSRNGIRKYHGFKSFYGGMGGLNGLGRSSSVSGVSKPMNTDALIAHLVDMTPDQRKQFASMHADDPMMLSAAKYVDNKIKQQANLSMAQQNGAPHL